MTQNLNLNRKLVNIDDSNLNQTTTSITLSTNNKPILYVDDDVVYLIHLSLLFCARLARIVQVPRSYSHSFSRLRIYDRLRGVP